jgi:predicted dehydrogenase/nucleoside-diphosphate-sugar epimerase
MDAKVWRVGIAGAGYIAPFHLAGLCRVATAQAVAVFDQDPTRADQLAKQFGVPHVCHSYTELLERVDVVHVVTPPASHAELAVRALDSGRHVFVEKPLASSVGECQTVVAAAERSGKTVGVDHSLLKDPFTVQAQRLVERGKLGRIVAVDCFRSQEYPEYAGGRLPPYAHEPGYPFRDLAIHALYQIELFLGVILQMHGTFAKRGDDPMLAFDEWQATIDCERGMAHLHLSWNVRPLQDLIWVHGTKGSLRIDRFGMHVTSRRRQRLPEHPQRLLHSMQEVAQTLVQVPANVARIATGQLRRYHGLQEMIVDFYQALDAQRTPLVDGKNAARLVGWVEQVAAAADAQVASVPSAEPTTRNARTLVTGATGLIGKALVHRLLAEGRTIRVFCRRSPPTTWLNDSRIEIARGDLGDPCAIRQALVGIATVYHAAGVVEGSDTAFHRGNVVGSQNLVDACLENGIKQLIYVSSLSVLAAPPNAKQILDESSPYEPLAERRGAYTQTKLAGEQIVVAAVRDRSLPAVIVRPGEVVGPGAPLFSPGIGRRLGDWVAVFGDGRLEVPVIHVDDLVDALIACEAKQLTDGTIVHLVDPQSPDQNELLRQYQAATGESLRVVHVPRPLVLALGLAAQTVSRAMGRPPSLSLYRLRSALAPRRFTVDRAQQLLDWRPHVR